MKWLGELDIPDRLSPHLPPLASQFLFAVFCCGAAGVLRVAINLAAPEAGPFTLFFPTVLLATLLARWVSGAIALAIAFAAAWYFVLPEARTLPTGADRAPLLAMVLLSNALVITIAEMFRRAVRHTVAERNARLEEHGHFLREIEHRVKNNFAVVASLLDLQRRRAKDEPTRDALGEALARVDSIARAHRHLYRFSGDVTNVEMRDYLTELCATLTEALFLRGAIAIECSAAFALLPRDRAVSVGLLVNELVTNAARHAFKNRDGGRIFVEFSKREDGYELVVADDGGGLPGDPESATDLGRRLIDAFVTQARGTLNVEASVMGTRYVLSLPD